MRTLTILICFLGLMTFLGLLLDCVTYVVLRGRGWPLLLPPIIAYLFLIWQTAKIIERQTTKTTTE